MPVIPDAVTIRSSLEHVARERPDWIYAESPAGMLTLRALDERANRIANGLRALGVHAGDRVPVMMGNHLDHITVFFALLKLGAAQVPVNVHLVGDSLRYVLAHSEPKRVIADAVFADALGPALAGVEHDGVIWRGGDTADVELASLVEGASAAPPPGEPATDDVIAILYTSGTTGPPKGVMVTDRMLRAAGWSCSRIAAVSDGDRMYIWEPLYHIGGNQVLVLALDFEITLHVAERFSASRFWHEVRAFGATRIHYLGGVLQLLLKQPERADDRDHLVEIAWGGGAPLSVWKPFEERFGVQIRENYGMTEASSLTSMNLDGRYGSVGRPCPYFDVRIADGSGVHRPAGEKGEIQVRGREPGLITPGYFRNEEATRAALRDGWLHTGDLGHFDEDGFLYYDGRLKDSIRRRGENISAWEVERTIERLDCVEECAAIGVPDDLGDEAVKVFVRLAEGFTPDARAVFDWCRAELASFQRPQWVAFVDGFEKTGTQRIKKERLSRSTGDAWSEGNGDEVVPPAA